MFRSLRLGIDNFDSLTLKIHLHVCYFLCRIAVCVEHCKCTCYSVEKKITVFNFYFAPSINLNGIIIQENALCATDTFV